MASPPDPLGHRYVNVPCPSGKHDQTLVTFRDHLVAAMFCVPCEVAWTEPITRPELRAIDLDRAVRSQ